MSFSIESPWSMLETTLTLQTVNITAAVVGERSLKSSTYETKSVY